MATVSTLVLNALGGGECLTMDRLAEQLPLSRGQISKGAATLVKRGWVERIEAGCFRLSAEGRTAYADGAVITSHSHLHGPKKCRRPSRNSLNTRLWRAMRLVRKFTLNDLLELAVQGERNPIRNARHFVAALERARYVMRLPRRVPGTSPSSNGFLRWTLVLDTGELPPMVRRGGTVLYDPNTRKEVPCARPTKVAAEVAA